jgi:zinc transporter ZupT
MVILVSVATVLATLLGGLFALKFRDKLHLVLGFSAGAVIGVAFFDLLPEAISLGSSRYEVAMITTVVAIGFVIFMLLDRLFSIHVHDDDDCENVNHRGKIAATTLSIHSFLDGAAIGLAFKVSPQVGAIVALAVLAHDFSDGINTVNLILKNQGSRTQAFRWLLLDAIAPALGALSTLFFAVPEATLGLILALFCGFFLYIGASDLLPESHHRHPAILTTVMTIIGILVLYAAVHLAGA